MKKSTLCVLSLGSLLLSTAKAAAIVELTPTSSSPIVISETGETYIRYTAKNTTSKTLNYMSVEPNYGVNSSIKMHLVNNYCSSLAPGTSCTFTIALKGAGQNAQFTLMPRVCAYKGAVCSVPILQNRISVVATKSLPSSQFPTPYAGTFYPIYNSGAGQWLPPNQLPTPPFQYVSAIFVAFAHAYPEGNGAVFTFEKGQPEEPSRLNLLVASAKAANPNIKIIMSLGWGKGDWDPINNDYMNHANIFIPSIITFIRNHQLDGVDIDDESIGESSGYISQENFNGVITNLRHALNYASLQDKKPYYLTITPAGNNPVPGGLVGTQVSKENAKNFDLINIQSYFDEAFAQEFFDALIQIGYPKNQIANGIDIANNCNPQYPDYLGMAGLFNWNMTQDSTCDFGNTEKIASLVGY